ncbi:MAG: hypothetical protein MJ218_00420 [Opitutales bacterium]|nr:hypothetical protein [Opitutales bacterium]
MDALRPNTIKEPLDNACWNLVRSELADRVTIETGVVDHLGNVTINQRNPQLIRYYRSLFKAHLLSSQLSQAQADILCALYNVRDWDNIKMVIFDGPVSIGYCYVDEQQNIIIHISSHLIGERSTYLPGGLMFHELGHALHSASNTLALPQLATYTSNFIKDIYLLKQNVTLANNELCKDSNTYQIYSEWFSIEECWNQLGFAEINGIVYVNELSDYANQIFSANPFTYHGPMGQNRFLTKEEQKAMLQNLSARKALVYPENAIKAVRHALGLNGEIDWAAQTTARSTFLYDLEKRLQAEQRADLIYDAYQKLNM